MLFSRNSICHSNRTVVPVYGDWILKSDYDNEAPSWQGLLELMCDELSDRKSINKRTFDGRYIRLVSESAQIIEIELSKIGKDIHLEIAKKVEEIVLSGDNAVISEFFQKYPLVIATTNYDKLAEELAGKDDCHSITPGFPIPRSPSRVNVYHVHGSIDSPSNMVVTADDYFRFINGQSYFSRKLSTILHENTVVILGYSLGDTNLKAIISDYKGFQIILLGELVFSIKKQSSPACKRLLCELLLKYAYSIGWMFIDSLKKSMTLCPRQLNVQRRQLLTSTRF